MFVCFGRAAGTVYCGRIKLFVLCLKRSFIGFDVFIIAMKGSANSSKMFRLIFEQTKFIGSK